MHITVRLMGLYRCALEPICQELRLHSEAVHEEQNSDSWKMEVFYLKDYGFAVKTAVIVRLVPCVIKTGKSASQSHEYCRELLTHSSPLKRALHSHTWRALWEESYLGCTDCSVFNKEENKWSAFPWGCPRKEFLTRLFPSACWWWSQCPTSFI